MPTVLNSNLHLIFSIMSLLFAVICIPSLSKVFKINQIPYQLEWLGQAIISFAICQIYTLLTFSHITPGLGIYHEVFHWMVYLTLIYFSLFSTKFVTKKCELVSKLFIFVSHMNLGAATIYLFMSVFMVRMGRDYTPQSLNLYTWFYEFKPVFFILETFTFLIYNIYTWKKLNFKFHVNIIKWILQICIAVFMMSYFIYPLANMFFIIFEVSIFTALTLIMYNVLHEKGRFLSD